MYTLLVLPVKLADEIGRVEEAKIIYKIDGPIEFTNYKINSLQIMALGKSAIVTISVICKNPFMGWDSIPTTDILMPPFAGSMYTAIPCWNSPVTEQKSLGVHVVMDGSLKLAFGVAGKEFQVNVPIFLA